MEQKLTKSFYDGNETTIETITDDDGVDSVVVYYRKNGSNDDYTKKLTSSFSKSNNTLTATLPAEYGVYDLRIDVVDSIQELSTSSSSTAHR